MYRYTKIVTVKSLIDISRYKQQLNVKGINWEHQV